MTEPEPTDGQSHGRPATQLWWCAILHIVNDGFVVSLAVLLPFIAADFDLTYTQSGFLRTVSELAICAGQIPAGIVSESVGEILVLGVGGVWFSLSYVALVIAFSYPVALVLILSSGLGGAAYHPVGTGLIANMFPHEKSGPAIGTLNFSGDLGKVSFSFLSGVMVVYLGWRGSFAVMGALGLGVSLLYLFFYRSAILLKLRQRGRHKARAGTAETPPTAQIRVPESPAELRSPAPDVPPEPRRSRMAAWGIRMPRQFTLYLSIGFLDVAVRNAVTSFLGFMLLAKGVEEGAYTGFMTLTFLGGACGKLLCGMPIRRLGAKKIVLVTELLMIGGCLALPAVPSGWSLVLFLPVFGFMLNGTSSVIYIGLAPTFEAARRSRGYALYYTVNFLAGAAAPLAFGLVGDHYSLATIFYVAAATMVLGLPLVFFLRDTN